MRRLPFLAAAMAGRAHGEPCMPSSTCLRTRRTTRSAWSIPPRWRSSRPSTSASGRAASPSRMTASSSISAPATTDTIEVIDTATAPDRRYAALRARTRALRALAGRQDALRRQRGRQPRHRHRHRRRRASHRDPVGVEPEGMGISPDGKTMVNTSETTNMAHFIDTETLRDHPQRAGRFRPRFAEFTPDGSEAWVSAEIGGTVSVIDNATREIKHKITFEIPGLRAETIQPVGVRITADGQKAYVGARAGQPRRGGRRRDLRGREICAGRPARLAARLHADRRAIIGTNGVSNDVTYRRGHRRAGRSR